MYILKKVWYPERFQGRFKKKNYFEGWYFKVADRDLENIYAIIPGVSLTEKGSGPHCFIQVLDGKKAESRYFRYPLKDFRYSRDSFEISISNSRFSREGMHLDIREEEDISSELYFSDRALWPKSLISPGAMGWYSYVPFMECYHGVVSMDHKVMGRFSMGNKDMCFDGGRGYIEKDWGSSFPKGWVWLQSNNFSKERVSIMLSVAKIPLGRKSFTGFICGLLLGDYFYVFSTYNGSKIEKLKISDRNVDVLLSCKEKRLSIEAFSKTSAVLASPREGSMEGRIDESMDAEVYLKLYEKDSGDVLFKGKGRGSGMEIVNPQAIL